MKAEGQPSTPVLLSQCQPGDVAKITGCRNLHGDVFVGEYILVSSHRGDTIYTILSQKNNRVGTFCSHDGAKEYEVYIFP